MARTKMIRVILPAFCVGVGIFLAALVNFHTIHEPFYNQRPLSTWLNVLSSTDSPENEKEQASAAILNIGTNALPLLFKRLSYTDNLWERAIYSRLGPQDSPHYLRVRSTALKGFQALGSNAFPAI